ncbi:MAG: hypothetical protein U1E17_06300 [Geminicoccaceae bacterium]
MSFDVGADTLTGVDDRNLSATFAFDGTIDALTIQEIDRRSSPRTSRREAAQGGNRTSRRRRRADAARNFMRDRPARAASGAWPCRLRRDGGLRPRPDIDQAARLELRPS